MKITDGNVLLIKQNCHCTKV